MGLGESALVGAGPVSLHVLVSPNMKPSLWMPAARVLGTPSKAERGAPRGAEPGDPTRTPWLSREPPWGEGTRRQRSYLAAEVRADSAGARLFTAAPLLRPAPRSPLPEQSGRAETSGRWKKRAPSFRKPSAGVALFPVLLTSAPQQTPPRTHPLP